jgi:hypothetical protein
LPRRKALFRVVVGVNGVKIVRGFLNMFPVFPECLKVFFGIEVEDENPTLNEAFICVLEYSEQFRCFQNMVKTVKGGKYRIVYRR